MGVAGYGCRHRNGSNRPGVPGLPLDFPGRGEAARRQHEACLCFPAVRANWCLTLPLCAAKFSKAEKKRVHLFLSFTTWRCCCFIQAAVTSLVVCTRETMDRYHCPLFHPSVSLLLFYLSVSLSLPFFACPSLSCKKHHAALPKHEARNSLKETGLSTTDASAILLASS